MTTKNAGLSIKHGFVVPGMLLLEGCSRAPSVDVLGSFFPGWLVCLATAVVLAACVRMVLLRLCLKVAFPVLVYPSLTALFTLTLWLVFFY